MQTSLDFKQFPTGFFNKNKEVYARQYEKEKDKKITYLEKVIAGQLAWINQNRVKLKNTK